MSAREPSARAPGNSGAPDLLSEPLIRAEDVAALLAVKTSTVYELSRRRHDPLPSVRIGRSKRFSRSAVAFWVAAQAST